MLASVGQGSKLPQNQQERSNGGGPEYCQIRCVKYVEHSFFQPQSPEDICQIGEAS